MFVEGSDPAEMHHAMAACLDEVFDELAAIRRRARAGDLRRPAWPCIVRTPKGWTGPKELDGMPVEGQLALPPGAPRQAPFRRRRAPRPRGAGGERGRPHAAPGPDGAPHGLPDGQFDALFTPDKPVVFTTATRG
ncbi:MAG TPA: hypothetical protein VM242_12075 [Acidimicrobiales bacterium]|nr:hypothetical protein [Acidimicrobiales bacterium]